MLVRLVALILALAATPVAFAQGVQPFQEGKHYFRIEPAQPTSTGSKVEVTEVFSYACPACALLQPQVEAWHKRKPANAQLVRTPAAWNPNWELVARDYYAAEAMGILDKTHAALFQALHVERKPLTTLEQLAGWYEQNAGVKAADVLATMRSFAIETKIRRSKQIVPRYGVDSTPTLIVAGKYRITGQSAGGYDALFAIIDFLVARESAARTTAPARP